MLLLLFQFTETQLQGAPGILINSTIANLTSTGYIVTNLTAFVNCYLQNPLFAKLISIEEDCLSFIPFIAILCVSYSWWIDKLIQSLSFCIIYHYGRINYLHLNLQNETERALVLAQLGSLNPQTCWNATGVINNTNTVTTTAASGWTLPCNKNLIMTGISFKQINIFRNYLLYIWLFLLLFECMNINKAKRERWK